jgi:hypothetical protein
MLRIQMWELVPGSFEVSDLSDICTRFELNCGPQIKEAGDIPEETLLAVLKVNEG